MSECSVCTEKFTCEMRKRIDCPSCEFKACAQCHQRYLLSTPEDTHCMSCRTGWTRGMLANNFTNVFLNKRYKEHRENVLLEREKSLMPETQPFVEAELKCRKYEREKVSLIDVRNKVYTQQATIMNSDLSTMGVANEDWTEARIERQRRVTEVAKKVSVLNCDIQMMEYAIGQYRNPNFSPKTREVRFIRACPADGCKGFLSPAWKCGLCEAHVCSHCHEIKDSDNLQDHVCDPQNVATAELLRKDTKPCPKCATMIFKISGCDQMYCTQCHTPFSWRTGAVVTGAIHNPHYYDYMRRTRGGVPRAPGDIPCGGLPDVYHFFRNFRIATTQSQQKYISDIHRNIGHVQYITNNRYAAARYEGNRDLRIKYMMNEMTEDDFKRKVQQREKAENKKRAIREVLVTYTTVATDIFQKYSVAVQGTLDPMEFYEELRGLREYTDGLLSDIQKAWKCVVPQFGATGGTQEHLLAYNVY